MRQHQEWHISGMCIPYQGAARARCNADVFHGTREQAQAYMDALAAKNAARPITDTIHTAWTDFQMREISYPVWDNAAEQQSAEAAARANVAAIRLPPGIGWDIRAPRPDQIIYGLTGGGVTVHAGPTQEQVDRALAHLIDRSTGSTGGSWWDERG